jgi:hypothetical protein
VPTATPSGTEKPPPPSASPYPTSSASPTPAATFDGTFPTSVLGLPVISVAQAKRLADAGEIDGRVVAVAGFYFSETPHCYSATFNGAQLEWTCRIAGFADSPKAAQQCTYFKDGMSCQMPPDPSAPEFMPDTLDGSQAWGIGIPVPVVFLLHSDDPRSLDCTPSHTSECAAKFVADRVVWADGHDVAPDQYPVYDRYSDTMPSPTRSLDQVSQAIGEDLVVVSAVATRANDVRTIEPRWNMAGDELLWTVKTVASGAQPADPVSDATIWLVDDATGAVLKSQPFPLASEFAPARLWVQAVLNGFPDDSDNPITPQYSVASDGTDLQSGALNGDRLSTDEATTYGPDAPMVLDPGTYTVGAWLDGDTVGNLATTSCSTEIALRTAADISLKAEFTPGNPCTWDAPAAPTFPT